MPIKQAKTVGQDIIIIYHYLATMCVVIQFPVFSVGTYNYNISV